MEEQKQIHALTGLKGIFIMLIVLTHTLPDSPVIRSIPLTSLIANYGGSWGNAMFFMLSGYLISMGYHERITEKRISFGDYLRRRLAKLYPMYIISNMAMIVLFVIRHGITVVNLKRIANVALLQAGGALENEFPFNGPTWFVCALFTCYILYYFLAYHSRNKTQYRICLFMGIVLGYILTGRHLQLPYCYNENGVAYINFFTGCMLTELFPEIRKKIQKRLSAILIAALGIIGYAMLRYGVEQTVGSGVTGYTFVLFPMIIYLASVPNVLSGILGSKPFVYFGKISVSVYFWHRVLQEIFQQATGAEEFADSVFALYMITLFPVCISIYQIFKRKKLL